MSIDKGGVRIDYRSDHQGLLISKTMGGQETRYIWDGLDLIAEMDSTGQVVKRYVHGAAIDEIIRITSGGTDYWAYQDGLGSVISTADDSGIVIATSSYDVYGNVRSGDIGPVLQRFAGMWWDEDAGLFYVRARWYSPKTGKYLQTDPLGISGGLNLYSYVLNNPVNFFDPYGLKWSWGGAFQQAAKGAMSGALPSSGGIESNFSGILGSIGAVIGTGISCFYSACATAVIGVAYGGAIGGAIGGFIDAGLSGSDFNNGSNSNPGGNGPGLPKRNPSNPPDLPNLPKRNPFAPPPDFPGFSNPSPKTLGNGGNFPGGNSNPGDTSGGTCPTFISELPHTKVADLQIFKVDINQNKLTSKLILPNENVLLRANVPIYGVAGGKGFTEYLVDYGKGLNPDEWNQIKSSTTPQNTIDINIAETLFSHADAHLYGNLADWNTGLKNWSHFPCNPPEDFTNLNGLYTLRLTTFGKDSQKVEDRKTVEVGKVVAQSLPGIANSPDKRVTMRFPEQALTKPFRIYTILPLLDVGKENPPLCESCKFVGHVYRIREPGDRFIKDVSLEFELNTDELAKVKKENIGIARYDTIQNKWIWLETTYSNDSTVFSTILKELPAPKAIYALLYHPEKKLSQIASPSINPVTLIKPARPGVLIDNSFEKDPGTFKVRDYFVGAKLTLDNKATPDGSYALKFINENHGGNFSSTVIDRPFDVREYSTMSFDYRIGPGVKIDFFLKVKERWYNLRFTGDLTVYNQRGVNVTNLGPINSVIADNKWHTASIDLRYLLRQQTRHRQIDEIVMANWDVTAFRKLEFGNNPRNAAYYIDNFKLTGPGHLENKSTVLIVDNFNEVKSKNSLGGAFGTYSTPGSRFFEDSLIDMPPGGLQPVSTSGSRNRALLLTFDTTKSDSYGGYWTSIAGYDLTDYPILAFSLHSDDLIPPITIGIRSKQGIEGKTDIRPYVLKNEASGWKEVRIPLTGLRGLTELSSPDVLFFSVTNKERSGKGSIWIDDLRFESKPFSNVTDFESPLTWALPGGDYSIFENGAGAISAKIMKDLENPDNSVLRISYGGTIGRDYGLDHGGFSYASWKVRFSGVDARPFSKLSLRVRGEQGSETPNFYLSDPARRIPLRAKEISPINQEWQAINLPLEHYEKEGIDLSHLDSLEIVFEWTKQSGTIYVDDIEFRK